LREGTAVQDFMYPSLLVAGGTHQQAVERVASLYAGLPVEPCLVSLRTAEMIKYACNCFHAVKITFANEIGTLCEQLGVSGAEVMNTVCKDRKLNISPAYLKPGFAFGGSCLPKDLRALTYRASRLDVKVPMLESVLPSNSEHLRRAIQNVLEQGGERIGIFGLAFKENTDDVRESPTVSMIEYLLGKGREVRVFDPHIELTHIYGSNKNFLFSSIPHIGRVMQASLDDLLGWADMIVVAQKPDERTATQIASAGCGVMDLVGAGLALRAVVQQT
jgi:GDP-mannose 6-dehydrogenase